MRKDRRTGGARRTREDKEKHTQGRIRFVSGASSFLHVCRCGLVLVRGQDLASFSIYFNLLEHKVKAFGQRKKRRREEGRRKNRRRSKYVPRCEHVAEVNSGTHAPVHISILFVIWFCFDDVDCSSLLGCICCYLVEGSVE